MSKAVQLLEYMNNHQMSSQDHEESPSNWEKIRRAKEKAKELAQRVKEKAKELAQRAKEKSKEKAKELAQRAGHAAASVPRELVSQEKEAFRRQLLR